MWSDKTSVQSRSCVLTLCDTMDCSTPGFSVHHQLLELASNSCPVSRWWHPTISSSVVPFSSCLQCFPASGSFQMSQFFTLGGQRIGASASASVLPMNIQDWFPLGLTALISLQSNWLSRVFSNTAVQKHQFSVLSFLSASLIAQLVKESACNAGDPSLNPGWGRSAGEGIGFPLLSSWASLWLS